MDWTCSSVGRVLAEHARSAGINPNTEYPKIVTGASNSNTQEVEAEESEGQSHPWLYVTLSKKERKAT